MSKENCLSASSFTSYRIENRFGAILRKSFSMFFVCECVVFALPPGFEVSKYKVCSEHLFVQHQPATNSIYSILSMANCKSEFPEVVEGMKTLCSAAQTVKTFGEMANVNLFPFALKFRLTQDQQDMQQHVVITTSNALAFFF